MKRLYWILPVVIALVLLTTSADGQKYYFPAVSPEEVESESGIFDTLTINIIARPDANNGANLGTEGTQFDSIFGGDIIGDAVTTDTLYGEWVWAIPGLGSQMYARDSRAWGQNGSYNAGVEYGQAGWNIIGSGAIKKINFVVDDLVSPPNAIDSLTIRFYPDTSVVVPFIDIPITYLLNSGFNDSASGMDTSQHYTMAVKADHFAVTRNQNNGSERLFSGYIDLFVPFRDSMQIAVKNYSSQAAPVWMNITWDHDGGAFRDFDYGRMANCRTDSTAFIMDVDADSAATFTLLDINDRGRGRLWWMYLKFDNTANTEKYYMEGDILMEIDDRDSTNYTTSSIEDWGGWGHFGNGAVWGTDAMGCTYMKDGDAIWYRYYRNSDAVIWDDSLKVKLYNPGIGTSWTVSGEAFFMTYSEN